MQSAIHPQQRHQLAVLAGGERLAQDALRTEWASHEVQLTLQTARQRFGHALCPCRTQPHKLQIRLRDGKYHLAVWPQEGPAHDTECAFFRDEVTEAASPVEALRAADPRGPSATATAGGRARLALSLMGFASGASGTPLSARALTLRLWEAAQLCRWHPNWSRDWGRVRYQLREAASEFTLNGHDAEALLFIPRPFRESDREALNNEWDRFVRDLVTRHVPKILIAPVRRICLDPTQGQPAVWLRHLRAPVGLHAACSDFLRRECRNAVSNSRAAIDRAAPTQEDDAGRPELLGLFAVEGSSRGGVWAKAGWLITVHASTYVPAASRDVVMLIEKLLEGRHSFQHLPSEQPASQRNAPDWLVRHVVAPDGARADRAALEILDRGSTAAFVAARDTIARRMAERGIPTWTWQPSGGPATRSVPPLPPNDFLGWATASSVLQEITASPQADYRFGPTTKFQPPERQL